MYTNTINYRELAKELANFTQYILSNFKDHLPLDGDLVEELSMMYQEELNKLNANQ